MKSNKGTMRFWAWGLDGSHQLIATFDNWTDRLYSGHLITRLISSFLQHFDLPLPLLLFDFYTNDWNMRRARWAQARYFQHSVSALLQSKYNIVNSTQSPIIRSGPGFPPFPVGIKCGSHADAQQVFRLQALVTAIYRDGVPYETVVDYFYRSAAVSVTLVDDSDFWAVHTGARVGIFRSWYVCYTNYLNINYWLVVGLEKAML